MTVNKDYAAELHVDQKDAGDSRILGLGSYIGGQLWVDDASHGQRGRIADIRGRWLGFDGNLPHKVLPFSGRRYTLVYFSKLRGWSVGHNPQSPHAKLLVELGFPLPTTPPRIKELLRSEQRLYRARPVAARLSKEDVGSQMEDSCELCLGSLPLLPSDRPARLALPRKVLCNGRTARKSTLPVPVTPKRRKLSSSKWNERTPSPPPRPVVPTRMHKSDEKLDEVCDSDDERPTIGHGGKTHSRGPREAATQSRLLWLVVQGAWDERQVAGAWSSHDLHLPGSKEPSWSLMLT
eukprot:s692_g4.t1